MTKTKKVKSAGRFGTGYGKKIREKIKNVEKKQRKKQICPFCKKRGLKRTAAGIWKCKKCNKTFASHAYYINNQ